MSPKKATVDKSTTIRAASRNKQRSQPKIASSPFGSSANASLASSLSSLFSPQPHGKDAALASLLASSSKPPVKLGQASGLAAFGSFSQPQTQALDTSVGRNLDDRLKEKRKDVQSKTSNASGPANYQKDGAEQEPTPSSSTHAQPEIPPSPPKDRMQKHAKASIAAVPRIPANRKPVFRPVLASSTAVSWPEMPVAGSKVVLHTLLEILAESDVEPILFRDLGRRSRRSSKTADSTSVEKMHVDGEAEHVASVQVLAGINSITRAIEGDIAYDLAHLQSEASASKSKEESLLTSVRVVFVCRHDLPQPALVAHLPMLVTARNAVLHACGPDQDLVARGVLLFALPSGSERLLADALNLRRASIIALTRAFSTHHLMHLLSVIQRETDSLCCLRANWLETAILSATYTASPSLLLQQPPSIKLLRTSQPADLNACKAAKRTRRKERSSSWKKKKMAALQQVKSLKADLARCKARQPKANKAKLREKHVSG